MANVYGAKQTGFDPHGAVYLATEMQNEGLTMVEVKQGIMSLTEPTKSFREAVYSGKLWHTGDQLLRWSMSNAVTTQDNNENIKLDKKRSKDRIDPVDAIINAYSLAMFDSQVTDLNSIILADDWSF